MRLRWTTALIALFAVATVAHAQTLATGSDPVEAHRAAGKNAAGGRDDTPDFYGLVTALCVAPLNAPTRQTPLENERAKPRLEPKKAFDELYWMGTPSRSAWALTTSAGIILYDTMSVADAEDLIVGSLKKLGLDPADRKSTRLNSSHTDISRMPSSA